MLPKINPIQTKAWKALDQHFANHDFELRSLFQYNPNRFNEFSVQTDSYLFDFSKNLIDSKTLDLLLDLAEEVMSITPLTGGKWYDLPEPIMVDTLVGPRKATQLWLNGNTNYVEIEMEDGSIFKATHHHKFLVQKEDGTKEWKMVINLEEGDDIVQIE